jgi:hypothetical protein
VTNVAKSVPVHLDSQDCVSFSEDHNSPEMSSSSMVDLANNGILSSELDCHI